MGSENQKPTTQFVYLSDLYGGEQSANELLFQSKLSTSNSDTKLHKKLIPFNESSETVVSYLQKLKFLGQYIESQNLYLPVYCYVNQHKQICSQQKQLEIYSQVYSINIKDEIVARKKHYQKFSQPEVWYILYSMLNACRKFEPFKLKSGNLKTNHVLLNERGHLKIINQLSQPEIKFFALANYYSPEQLDNMREGRNIKLHQSICQTFSIAIILLEICTFIDGQSFYDMYRMRINEVGLQRAEQLMEKLKYSRLLVNLIKIMRSGANDRPLPSQIFQTFKPYEYQILNLISFKFDTSKMGESLQNSKISVNSSRYY